MDRQRFESALAEVPNLITSKMRSTNKEWQVALVKLDPWCELIWHQVEQISASLYSFKYWLLSGGSGSVEGNNYWYLEVLGQHEVELVVTWWYWVSVGWYWSVLRYLVILGQNRAVQVAGVTGWLSLLQPASRAGRKWRIWEEIWGNLKGNNSKWSQPEGKPHN